MSRLDAPARAALRHAPAFACWVAVAAVLAELTTRARFWYVMTDELLYERLAIDVVRLHSPLPHVHGVLIGNVNQLYPLLLSTVFRHGPVGANLHSAHILNAFVMSSAAVPAFFLARRVTRSRWTPALVALLTVTTPWMVYSTFLLTEVAAYPAFVLALLACQACATAPSRRSDGLAVAALALAVLARTQFVVLLLALPLTIALAELGGGTRLRVALTRAWARHRLLAGAYAVVAAAALVLVATGRHPLGTYSQTASGNPLPGGIVQQAAALLAAVATGTGLVPLLAGGAWLVGSLVRAETPERRAFALLGTITTVLLTLEVASYDIRFAEGIVHDRYLFYVAPIFFVALGALLTGAYRPRRALAVPTAVLVFGLVEWKLPALEKLDADTPGSLLNRYLERTLGGTGGARATLIAATLLAALVVLVATALFARRFAVALLACLTFLVPAEGAYAFKRLYDVPGPNGYPLTLDQSGVYGWVDQAVGANATVTMIPYPYAPGDFWASVSFWWDLEFWNKSVDRDAVQPGTFEWTPETFPKLSLAFDPATGAASISPRTDVVQTLNDVRFRVAGRVVVVGRNAANLVRPDRPWRADWLTLGLYDDGWTRPATTARLRVFPVPGQSTAVTRHVDLVLDKPGDVRERPYLVRDDLGTWRGTVSGSPTTVSLDVCVPADRPADAILTTSQDSTIYGDPTSTSTANLPRAAGLFIRSIAVGDPGAACTPRLMPPRRAAAGLP